MKIRRRQVKTGVPALAMGDIAFNLLIFFVMLARIQDDSHLKWEPAKTETVKKVRPARVSITVDKDNKLYLNGQEIGESQLADAISKLLGNAPKKSRTVLLKIHKDTQAVRFEPIIEAVSEAGGELVHILDEERK